MIALFYVHPSEVDLTEFGPSAVLRPHPVTLEEGTFHIVAEEVEEIIHGEGVTYVKFKGQLTLHNLSELGGHKIVIVP